MTSRISNRLRAAVRLLSLGLAFAARPAAGAPKGVDLRGVDLHLKKLDGTQTLLQPLAGKQLTLVNLWATWCVPCQAEMPALDSLRKRLRPQGFEVIAISMDDGVAMVKDFLAKHKVSYPVVMSSGDKTTQALSAIEDIGAIEGLPTSILVGPTGEVIEVLVGAPPLGTLTQEVTDHLKKTPPH